MSYSIIFHSPLCFYFCPILLDLLLPVPPFYPFLVSFLLFHLLMPPHFFRSNVCTMSIHYLIPLGAILLLSYHQYSPPFTSSPVFPLFASFFWVQTCPMEMKTGIKTLRSQVRSVPSPSYPVHTSGKITTGPCHCLRDCQQVPTISDKKCSEFCTFLPTECLSHGFGTTVVPPLAPYWSKLLNRNQK